MIYIVEGKGLIPLPSNFLSMKPPSPIDYSISLEEGMLHMFYFIILTDGIITHSHANIIKAVFRNMHSYFRKPPSNCIMFVSMKQHHLTSLKRN